MSDGVDGLDVRSLRVLVALAEEGTFTDAAIRLGTGQPAVSRALARLEAHLDVQLLQRTTRSLRLTPAGEACYAAAVEALAALANLCAQASQADGAHVEGILAKACEFRDQLHAAHEAADLMLADIRRGRGAPAPGPSIRPAPPAESNRRVGGRAMSHSS